MKQIIIIGWWWCFPTKEAFYKSLATREYNPFEKSKNRRERLTEQTEKTHQIIIPTMPCKQNADYIAWKIWFERHFEFLNNEDIILIGHSQWAVFLTKRLSENQFPKQIKQLHLVSWVFDDNDLDEETIGNFIFDPSNLNNIESQVNHIFIYHSKDDDIVPFRHGEELAKHLPSANFLIFENRGHFREYSFPELLENIKSE